MKRNEGRWGRIKGFKGREGCGGGGKEGWLRGEEGGGGGSVSQRGTHGVLPSGRSFWSARADTGA